MLFLFFVLLFLTAVCLILFMPALWGKHIYNSYHDSRTVNCPETHAPVAVRFNALRAAISGMSGKPKLSLADCSRWPERADCNQACILDAERATPQADSEVHLTLANHVAHLPALVAAGAAWVLGMAWHSEYMFRSVWARTVGLTDQQAHDLARLLTPHLITVGCCVLFSYGIAALLAWQGKRSLWRGIQMSITFWLLIAAALLITYPLNTGADFLWIEGGYTILAALLIGAIVGGLPQRVFLKDDL